MTTDYTDTPAVPGAPRADGTLQITPSQLGTHHGYNYDDHPLDELLTDILDDYDGVTAAHPWITDVTVNETTGDVSVTHWPVNTEGEDGTVTEIYHFRHLCTALGAWSDWTEVTHNDPTSFNRRAATAVVTEDWDRVGSILDIELTDEIVQFLVYGRLIYS